jgi:hypothetical protein
VRELAKLIKILDKLDKVHRESNAALSGGEPDTRFNRSVAFRKERR